MLGSLKLRTVALAAAALAITVWTFQIPLATVLIVGVWLLCPLMMMGMHGHGWHGGHASGSDHPASADTDPERGESRNVS